MVERITGRAADDFDRFMHSAFAGLDVGEKVGLGDAKPRRDGGGVWFEPRRWRPGEPQRGQGLHFNCCAFEVGAARALGEATTRAFVVMLDDLGDMPGKSKVALDRVLKLPEPVRPHAIISTRRHGNHINAQACWFIEPVPPKVAQALVKAACKAGWGDPEATGGLRWARPPGSIKRDNDHAAELLGDNLAAPRIEIAALAAALGVPDFMAEVAQERAAPAGGREIPEAATVRAAMAVLTNDLDRNGWVRIGMALKSACGPGGLSDDEGGELFDRFSAQHASYDRNDARQRWRSFRPSRVGFGTVVWQIQQQVLEIGSGAFVGGNPVPCLFVPDVRLARLLMERLGIPHARVVPAFDPVIAGYAELPEGAARIVVACPQGAQRPGAAILFRRAAALGIGVTITDENGEADQGAMQAAAGAAGQRPGAGARWVTPGRLGDARARTVVLAIGRAPCVSAMRRLGLAGGLFVDSADALHRVFIGRPVESVAAVLADASHADAARALGYRLARHGIELKLYLETGSAAESSATSPAHSGAIPETTG